MRTTSSLTVASSRFSLPIFLCLFFAHIIDLRSFCWVCQGYLISSQKYHWALFDLLWQHCDRLVFMFFIHLIDLFFYHEGLRFLQSTFKNSAFSSQFFDFSDFGCPLWGPNRRESDGPVKSPGLLLRFWSSCPNCYDIIVVDIGWTEDR